MTTDRSVLAKLEEIAVHLETAETFLEDVETASAQDEAWKKEALKRIRLAQDGIGDRKSERGGKSRRESGEERRVE